MDPTWYARGGKVGRKFFEWKKIGKIKKKFHFLVKMTSFLVIAQAISRKVLDRSGWNLVKSCSGDLFHCTKICEFLKWIFWDKWAAGIKKGRNWRPGWSCWRPCRAPRVTLIEKMRNYFLVWVLGMVLSAGRSLGRLFKNSKFCPTTVFGPRAKYKKKYSKNSKSLREQKLNLIRIYNLVNFQLDRSSRKWSISKYESVPYRVFATFLPFLA